MTVTDPDAIAAEYFSGAPEVRRCPVNHMASLRDQPGLYFHSDIDAYVVSRFSDAIEVLRNPIAFSSKLIFGRVAALRERATLEGMTKQRPELEPLIKELKPRRTPVLVNCDPPNHMRQRRMVHASFAMPRITHWQAWIENLCTQLIDGFGEGGTVEMVSSFCIPFPVLVIAKLLGVSDDRLGDFKRWSDDFLKASGNDALSIDEQIAAMKGQAELLAFFRAEIAERRAAPRDDLITDMVNARQSGDEPFSDDELMAMCSQFLVAGNETTTSLLASAFLSLARQPDIAQALRQDASRIAPFVEEVLRLDGPVQGAFRLVTQDIEVGGFPLKKGDQVFVVHGAANRDPRTFGPDKADADYDPNGKHLSFGYGEHFCLGSNLARLEAKIAIGQLLARFSTLAVPADFEVNYAPTYILRSIPRLSLELTPA